MDCNRCCLPWNLTLRRSTNQVWPSSDCIPHNDTRMQLALALVVLLNAAISLEDPFDNVGLDGIYIDEALSDVQQVQMCLLSTCVCLRCRLAVTAVSTISRFVHAGYADK